MLYIFRYDDETFECKDCGQQLSKDLMDYEEDVCIFCVEDDERSYPDQDY